MLLHVWIGKHRIETSVDMDFDRFYEMAEPYIRQVIKKDLDLKKIAAMVKTRI